MSCPQILVSSVVDERAWRASTIDERVSWYDALSEDCVSAAGEFIQRQKHHRQIVEIPIPEWLRDVCGECLQPALTTLQSGRGFALVECIPLERYTAEDAQGMYWAMGHYFGIPFEQDIKGTLLYDVRDTGQNVSRGARFSVTNAESSFHMDNSFGHQVPDFVGLLCLNTAKSGGESQLISAYALHNELLANYPDVLETLYQPFYFDRRGQFKPGESPTYQAPIFHWTGRELTIRYLRYYIQVGHQKAGTPLTSKQEKALETLETLLRRPDFRITFSLRPGQMLFVNNRWILHNRTAFTDFSGPEHQRHYVRLWLRRKLSV